MATPTNREANVCLHQILQVDEFNSMGAAVTCLRCRTPLQIPAQNVEDYYYPFTHVSPEGPDSDISILVNARMIDK